MALLYSQSTRNLMIGRGLLANFSSPCAISVYSGTQPTSASIINNWSLYSQPTSNFLAHFIGASWTQPSNGILMQLTVPPTVPADHTGTASWAILWTTNVSAVTVAGASLPSNNFAVVACSDAIGPGVIRFVSTSITAATAVTILDGSIGAIF